MLQLVSTPMHSSDVLQPPSTPTSSHFCSSKDLQYRPLSSSPLATPHTPVSSSARRHAQLKLRTPSTPVPSHTRIYPSARRITSSGGSVFACGGTPTPEDPQKSFLREKFRVRCIERAAKAREKAIAGKRRYINERSSDGFDEIMDDDEEEEEDDDDVMGDELFRRIVANENRRSQHSYRVSYSRSVGSSFDPDIETILDWERELTSSKQSPQDPSGELNPVDLDDEELEAYAEEYARTAAIADFEDVPHDELFSLSDEEDLMGPPRHRPEDVEMTP